MIVRALDENHDWTFGKGKNNYLSDNDAIAQEIDTRLQSFVGDCFFSNTDFVDWWNILDGSKNIENAKLQIQNTILNTIGVTSLLELSLVLGQDRTMRVEYEVVTVYSINQNLSGSVTVGGYQNA